MSYFAIFFQTTKKHGYDWTRLNDFFPESELVDTENSSLKQQSIVKVLKDDMRKIYGLYLVLFWGIVPQKRENYEAISLKLFDYYMESVENRHKTCI